MGSLTAHLRDLRSPTGKLAAFRAVMDHVYGPRHGPGWKPQPYAEYKGRYLWTDAFGVCNYITLAAETGETHYLEQADALITAVHDTLGKDRQGRLRLGDATDDEPTRGGLRIGKVHPEGHPDGDGQYFHYITKWAFALNRMSIAKNDRKYNRWAVQLVQATHPHFVAGRKSARPRMFWKISVDMSRPVVLSEGNLDPFDGLVTYRLIRDTSQEPGVLRAEISDMELMVANKYQRYHSDDPLDLGEALWLSHWGLPAGEAWARVVAQRSAAAVEELWQDGYFEASPRYRLAFREFGTTLGVQVNPVAAQKANWGPRVQQLHALWAPRLLDRDSDISPVMFCSSLIPGVWQRDDTRLTELSRRYKQEA